MTALLCPKCNQATGDKQLMDFANQFICSACFYSCPMAHYNFKMKEAEKENSPFPLFAKRMNGEWTIKTNNNILLINL